MGSEVTLQGPANYLFEVAEYDSTPLLSGEWLIQDGQLHNLLGHVQEFYLALYLLVPLALLVAFQSLTKAFK